MEDLPPDPPAPAAVPFAPDLQLPGPVEEAPTAKPQLSLGLQHAE